MNFTIDMLALIFVLIVANIWMNITSFSNMVEIHLTIGVHYYNNISLTATLSSTMSIGYSNYSIMYMNNSAQHITNYKSNWYLCSQINKSTEFDLFIRLQKLWHGRLSNCEFPIIKHENCLLKDFWL